MRADFPDSLIPAVNKQKQRQRQRLENRPERTVFYNIFATMMLVLAVELLMAVASILAINVTEQLDENAKDLLTMRVRNRASYVQEILRNAEDLEQLSDQITATTQQLLKSGDISLDTLDNGSEQSDALLVALAPQLLDTLRTKQVTGIFLILNTHDLDTCEVGKKMPGIYLRDMDPDARPSERNSDLLLERASATVVKELAIGTDKGWQPAFPYQGDTKGGILRTVFQTAYKSDAGLSAESYGRWTTNSYCLAGDDRHAIAYSMPLILPDGTVYGVVGVELLTDYLQTKLPFTELLVPDTLTDRQAAGITLESVVEGIINFKRHSRAAVWLEIFILPGVNDSMESAERFRALAARIMPDKVQLITLDRPGLYEWVQPEDDAVLDQIAGVIGRSVPVEKIARHARRVENANHEELDIGKYNELILKTLRSRPCTAEDISVTVGIEADRIAPHLRRMERAGLIVSESGMRGTFYRPVK